MYLLYWILGWSDFRERTIGHVVPNCYRTQIPKFNFEMLLFNLAQGITNFLLLGLHNFFLNTFLETVPGGLFDYFCKSKKIRETEQNMCFSFDQVKNNVAHFEGLKKLQEKGRYSQICFWKWKLCRARARPNLPILGNWTHTNITDRQQCIQFRKSQKVVSLHLTLYSTYELHISLNITFTKWMPEELFSNNCFSLKQNSQQI